MVWSAQIAWPIPQFVDQYLCDGQSIEISIHASIARRSSNSTIYTNTSKQEVKLKNEEDLIQIKAILTTHKSYISYIIDFLKLPKITRSTENDHAPHIPLPT